MNDNVDKTGGPAFPVPNWNEFSDDILPMPQATGMTLQDAFAGLVLHALWTNPENAWGEKFEILAYQSARDMIAERNKKS